MVVCRVSSVLLVLVLVARAAEVPFGHADRRASPTDPVGFAGQAAELYPTAEMNVGGISYQGIGFAFAVDTSGLAAIGSRIYLHSPGMLICIGEN